MSKTKTIRYEVPDQDGWVEIYDPSDMSHGRVVAALEQLRGFQGNGTSPAQDQWLRERISAWHLIHADTDIAMNDPQSDDLNGLKQSTLQIIMENWKELLDAAIPFGPKRPPSST